MCIKTFMNTMFSNSRWWGFKHMLSKVNENLVQFTTTQQVKVLYDLNKSKNK